MRQMKNLRLKEIGLIGLIVGLLIVGGFFVGNHIKMANLDPQIVMAAVTNPSPGSPGYIMDNLPIPGNYTTGTVTNKVRFKMPWPATLIGVSGICRTVGGASTMTVDVTEGGTTVLSTPLAINATTVAEAVITDTTIADEATIGITTRVSGTGTFVDPTVQLIFKRK